MEEKIKSFHAIWNKDKNKFIKFEDKIFDDGYGHTGILTKAYFYDKKSKIQCADAWIKWDRKYYVKCKNIN